ncbi:MAG: Nif3-like dinuclear metal center hexameric protein [Nitriliruptoraceae bacterium]
MASNTVGAWIDVLHARYPPSRAEPWDNVGLQVGDPDWPVERVLVSLDVTAAVLDEAADGAPTLLVAHHPLLFRPVTNLTPASPAAALALQAASSRVAVAAAHTNLDVATDGTGTCQPVADLLELRDVRPLTTARDESSDVRLVVFVPAESLDAVIDAMSAAGAGVIGDYERCTFRVAGTGTFRPGVAADPYRGEVGRDARVDEFRLETAVATRDLAGVITAMQEAHPYEEVAHDVYPLAAAPRPGIGLVGHLPDTMTLGAMSIRIRDDLPSPHLRTAGDRERPVTTVAIVGGAGDSMIDAAIAAGAQVLVTGDLRHHVTLDALQQGLALIDAGHHATEWAAMARVVDALAADGRRQGLQATVLASRTPTDPWAADVPDSWS